MLQITLLLFALCVVINGKTNNDCSKYKDCASCVKAHRPLPGFQRYCGWHTDKSSCDEPFAIIAGSNVVVREPFMCPQNVPTAEKYRYTDALGRSLYGLTLAVRNKDPAECLANSQPDIQLIKRYEVECDQSRNLCAAMLAVSKRDKKIYVVYKSSNMDKQLITEFIHMVAAQLGVWEKFEGGGGVATYFYAAFERLFKGSGMKDDLIKLKKVYPGYEVWCTGHSLGASMSSMTALYLIKKKIFPAKLVRLITFGEPRTGNVAFAQAVEENVKFRYRVIHRGDPMTNMPATINPIGLLLSSTVAERQPYFYRYLVYYDNDMNEGSTFSVCTLSEDAGCRNLALANNALDHTNYFAVNAETYLSKGCKGDLLKIIGNRTITTTKTTETITTTTGKTVATTAGIVVTDSGTTNTATADDDTNASDGDIATTDSDADTSGTKDDTINTTTDSTASTTLNVAYTTATGVIIASGADTTDDDADADTADADTTDADVDVDVDVDVDTTDADVDTADTNADTTDADTDPSDADTDTTIADSDFDTTADATVTGDDTTSTVSATNTTVVTSTPK